MMHILFEGDVIRKGQKAGADRLSALKSGYTLVVFGSGWCPKCKEELSQMAPLYDQWKSKGVEVIFVSLDTDEKVFNEFTKNFPFISMCDYKKWDTKAAKDFFVIGTPTMFLLDNSRKILLRPNSVKDVSDWVESNIRM